MCIASLLGLLHFHTKAQVNTDSIALAVASTEGQVLYQKLVDKLSTSDSTLQRLDFLTLYYGAVEQPRYNLNLIDSLETQIKDDNLLQQFIDAYELADTLLAFHPVSITAYFEKSFACYALKRIEEEEINKQKYRMFVRCVLSSGDGSEIQPYKVVSYNDAIETIKYLQVKYKGIQEANQNILVATLTKKRNGSDLLYFKLLVP